MTAVVAAINFFFQKKITPASHIKKHRIFVNRKLALLTDKIVKKEENSPFPSFFVPSRQQFYLYHL